MKSSRTPDSATDSPVVRSSSKQGVFIGNCCILDPTGNLLGRCSRKRADWYVKRELGDIVNEHGEILPKETLGIVSIRLRFSPQNVAEPTHELVLQESNNCCVVCASNSLLTRHHIFPLCYRKVGSFTSTD